MATHVPANDSTPVHIESELSELSSIKFGKEKWWRARIGIGWEEMGADFTKIHCMNV